MGAKLLLVLLCLFCFGCSRDPLYHQESFVFGTRVELQIHGAPPDKARDAAAAVLREFDRLHAAFNAWQPSELTALNQAIARGDKDIAVSDELAALISDAQKIAADSDDLFNPALGKLIAAWGFHADTYAPRVPAADDIAALVAKHPRLADLHVRGARVSSDNPAVQLDFGGYAKGYALDRAAAILHARGIDHALINIGGNVMALGQKGSQPWRVGIANPRGTGALGTVELRDGEAIGTSGDYQRYFEVDGKRYCHVLDGRSGYPATAAQGVTVLIPKGPRAGTLSDATSKPIFIATDSEWPARARALGVRHALRVGPDGAIVVTAPMQERIEWTPGVSARVAP